MKNLINYLFIIIMIFASCINRQETKSNNKNIINNDFEKDILSVEQIEAKIFSNQKITVNFILATCYPISYYNSFLDSKEISLYNLNVFSLCSEINAPTKLQKAEYKKTDKYKIKLDSIKKIRNKMIKISYIEWEPTDMDYITCNGSTRNEFEYDIEKECFEFLVSAKKVVISQNGFKHLTFDSPYYDHDVLYNFPYCIKFIKLPLKYRIEKCNKKLGFNYGGDLFDSRKKQKVDLCFFQLKTNTKTALKIEKNSKDIGFIFIFQIHDIIQQRKGRLGLIDKIITSKTRCIVYNKISNEIYFDKIYIE